MSQKIEDARRVNLLVPKPTLDAFTRIAAKRNLTRSELMRNLMVAIVKRETK